MAYIIKADLRGLEGEDLAVRLKQAGLSESLTRSITDKCISGRLLSMMEESDVMEEFKEDPIENRVHLRAFLRELNTTTDPDETEDQDTISPVLSQQLQNAQSEYLTSTTVTDSPVVSKQNKESTESSHIQSYKSTATCTDQETVVSDEDKLYKETVVSDEDKLYKEFKFPIPQSVKRKLEDGQKVDEPEKKKIVRESLACLEALVGEEPTKNQIKIAAKKICDIIPQLKDPMPPSFPDKMEFPYWGTVRFMMGKRKLNAKAYLNREAKLKNVKKAVQVVLSENEYETMNAELLKESKKKKLNVKAVLEMQQLTFPRRNDTIISKEMDVNSIKSDFPFLMHDLLIRNELCIHISKQKKENTYNLPTEVQTFENNWDEIVKRSLNKDPDLCGEELSGFILENINVNFPKCEPIVYFAENNSDLDVKEVSKKVKLKDWPWLLCFQEDSDTFRQLFVVLDNNIFLEIEADQSGNAPFAKSVATLLGIYYVFNLEYKETQKLLYTFLEEFVLGVKPSRQTLRYRKAVQATII